MIVYYQKDERWAKEKLGHTNLTIGGYGCLLTCISMLDGRCPKELNQIFSSGNCFRDDGLIIWVNVEKTLNKTYSHVISTDYLPCIAETNYYKNKGYPQHFFVIHKIGLNSIEIADPLDGQLKVNKYPIVSFRIIK